MVMSACPRCRVRVSAAGTARTNGASGPGHQAAYNGHLLYTFADDQPGQVTGQGVQGFFVATPGLAATTRSPAPSAPAAPSGSGYGY